MKFKKFFKSRTVRVIFATVCILCTLFTFVLPSFAVEPDSWLPIDTYSPPQMEQDVNYVYGRPYSYDSVRKIFSIFYLQNYFGGFNHVHPICIMVVPSGDDSLIYLVGTDNEADYVYNNGYQFFFYTYRAAGVTRYLYYYLLTDHGFVYSDTVTITQNFTEVNLNNIIWYLNTYDSTFATEISDWTNYSSIYGSSYLTDVGDTTGISTAYNALVEFYNMDSGYATGYDNGYTLGYDLGYLEGINSLGYQLDISSIIDGVLSGLSDVFYGVFNITLFGVNISGLLMLLVGCVIIFFVIRFIWGFIK